MINFAVKEMTALRYFIPLVEEARRRGIKSNFFIGGTNKYNCPFRYHETLRDLANEHQINMYDIDALRDVEGLTFYIENVCLDQSSSKNKKVSLTYQNDFINEGDSCYHNYVNYVDHVIFPSEFFAKFHGTVSDKNLYLGSPKYDVEFTRDDVLRKYDLPRNTNALILFPKLRDLGKSNIVEIYNHIRALGYNILVKSRGKDPIMDEKMRGDRYFEDASWHPHTSMELMSVSDLIINFGSTAIKECVMMRKPVINFPIKPHQIEKTFPFLYEYDYCRQLQPNCDFREFEAAVDYLTRTDHTDAFSQSIKSHLFNYKSAPRILDFFMEDINDVK